MRQTKCAKEPEKASGTNDNGDSDGTTDVAISVMAFNFGAITAGVFPLNGLLSICRFHNPCRYEHQERLLASSYFGSRIGGRSRKW